MRVRCSGSRPAAPASEPGVGRAAGTDPSSLGGRRILHCVAGDSGRDTFRAQCTECHYSSEFSDAQFKFKWSRRTGQSLYDLIITQMPETAPGSLTADESVDLVAYILRMNGFEEGSAELAADEAVSVGHQPRVRSATDRDSLVSI